MLYVEPNQLVINFSNEQERQEALVEFKRKPIRPVLGESYRYIYWKHFTIVYLTNGGSVTFNHKTLTIRHTSSAGRVWLVERFDEDGELNDTWIDDMTAFNLWKRD